MPDHQSLISKTFNEWNIPCIKAELRKFGVKFKANSKKQDLFNLLHLTLFEDKYKNNATVKYDIFATVIQKFYRGWKTRCQLKDQGPGFHNRFKCNNETDPITLCDICDIPDALFFSYSAGDDRIYGFDIRSFKQMLNHGQSRNPYNREVYPTSVISACNRQWRRLKIDDGENSSCTVVPRDISTRAFRIFHDAYLITGNFVDHEWFLRLTRFECMNMYRHLWDIWHGLPLATKRRFSPDRRMFDQVEDVYISQLFNTSKLQSLLLSEFEYLSDRQIADSEKTVFFMWVLIALTRVSSDAAMALSHLII